MHQLCVRPCCFSRETSSDNWLQVAASEPNAWALSASEARCSEAVAAVLLRSCCISSDRPWACGFQAASMRAVRSRRRCSPRASTASSSSRRVPSSARIDAAAFEFDEASSLSIPSSAASAAVRRSDACSPEASLEAATDETSAEVLACSFASSAASLAASSATPAATAAAASLAASLAAAPEASSAIRDSIPASMHCKEARLLAASSRMKSSASSISSRSPALTATSSSRLAAARPSTELRSSSRKSSAAPALPPLSSRIRTTIDWQLCNSAPKVPHS
mmetsp:Transcript_127154/g.406839  ORF Transcript_127154/g.406839 Transcript_127154/m.406839 type:complete len:279 (+) Transcript_127154:220-1056(+)